MLFVLLLTHVLACINIAIGKMAYDNEELHLTGWVMQIIDHHKDDMIVKLKAEHGDEHVDKHFDDA